MTKLAPEWVRTIDPVIRSPARYRWTTAPTLLYIGTLPWRMPTYMYMVCFHCFGYIDLGPITVMFHNAAIIISIYSFLTIGPHLTQLWCNIGLRIHIYTQTNTSIAITSRCEINKCDMCDKWSWKIYKTVLSTQSTRFVHLPEICGCTRTAQWN